MEGDPVLVVASEAEHPGAARVWGTGGWTPPEEREARDWVALCRLLGWGVAIASPSLERIPDDVRWVLIACDPDDVGERLAGDLARRLERRPLLVVARAAAPGTPLAGLAGCARAAGQIRGRRLRWCGPGEAAEWMLEHPVLGRELDAAGETLLALDGKVAAAARRVGQGAVVSLGMHPSAARDAGGAVTAALRKLLTSGSPHGVAWLDTEGVLALRMDDPGGSQNVHLDPFAYRELGPREWEALAAALRDRQARLGVAAVPGWVDDGDASRGELLVRGAPVERSAGRVHPSWEVAYRDAGGDLHDYAGEFALLRDLAQEGVVDIALHGHTHLHPDLGAWANAPDRHTSVDWYREFGTADESAPGLGDSLVNGGTMLADFFGSPPDALVFPGDEWTDEALERALELDLALVASYYVALRDGDRFCWAEQVCSPYLDDAAPSWFDAGVPVVGYFHARDVSLRGVGWVRDQLDAWRRAGARRMIGLGELALDLQSRVGWEEAPDGTKLVVTAPRGRSPRRLRIRVDVGGGASAVPVRADVNGRAFDAAPVLGTPGPPLVELSV